MCTVSRESAARGHRCAPFALVEPLESRAHLSAGDPDPTFGHRGVASYPHLGTAVSMVAQRRGDGKLRVLVADAGGVERFTLDGQLDPTFGANGRADVAARRRPWTVRQIALAPDGGVIVAGMYNVPGGASLGTPVTFVERLTKDGQLDAAFGAGGVVTLPGVPGHGGFDGGYLAVQRDGAILVGGTDVGPIPGDSFDAYAEVVRLNADGSLDTAYGNGGIATNTQKWRFATMMFARPGGSVLLIGGGPELAFSHDVFVTFDAAGHPSSDVWGDSNGGVGVNPIMGSGVDAAALGADGFLVDVEAGFPGVPQEVITPSGGHPSVPFAFNSGIGARPTALTIAPDGAILVAAASTTPDGSTALAVARLNSDGTPDPTFADAGTATVSVAGAETVSQLLVLPDGSTLLAGGTVGHRLLLAKVQGGQTTPATEPPRAVGFIDRSFTYVQSGTAERDLFDVTYAAGHPIDFATLDDGDVLVTGPHGYRARGRLYTVVFRQSGNRTPAIAQYSIPAPGGTWDPTDDGAYTVHLLPRAIADVTGQFAAAGVIGTLTVKV